MAVTRNTDLHEGRLYGAIAITLMKHNKHKRHTH